MEILITVYDLDLTAKIEANSDIVDNIFIVPSISAVPSPRDPFSDTMTFSGSISHIQVAFRLTCSPDLYGSDCSVYCVDTNDTSGHFSCDPVTGDRICLGGYQNPSTDCIECTQPAHGCSE